MDPEINSTAEVVERLAKQTIQIEAVWIEETAVPLVLIPNGMTLVELKDKLSAPLRIERKETFIALESFTRYVNVHKTAASQIRMDRAGNAQAILDGVMALNPSWESHRATFSLTYSVRWFEWHQKNKKSFSQKDFAEWIEDRARDFVAPKAGAMLDIARTLEAEGASKFNSALKEENNDVKFGFERTTNIKAGIKGDLTVPSRFTISIPVLEGEEPRVIELRLRYDLTEGKLTLSFDLLNLQQILDEVRQSVAVVIANETTLRPFLVGSI